MLKEREKAVNNSLAFFDVILAWISFLLVLVVNASHPGYWNDRMLIVLMLFIVIIWFVLSKSMGIGELYRSRPYSILLFNCFGLSIFGTSFLGALIYFLGFTYLNLFSIILFGVVNCTLTVIIHIFIYYLMKVFRKRGLNFRSVIIMGDKSSSTIVNQMIATKEWGYRIVAIVGNDDLKSEFGHLVPVLSPDKSDVAQIIAEKTIDELIYCKEKPDMEEVESLIYSCSEVGVIFRMYSPFFNMLTNKMHLHYFNTTPLLTFSNTPQDYWSLRLKQIFDFFVSGIVIVLLSPLFLVIAAFIKLTSKGPVFFKQIRVGVRGRKFLVYKFRTMVSNAEELKKHLDEHNEMDGPVFKMTNDPRITMIGKFLRKTSLDELPQFFNVFMGDMSIVGPRPPIPEEVRKYERWQLRRLSMKPGITCVWQISPSRNDILFDDWMKMDLEYIDSWSLKLDFVIVLKTIRTMLRADGK
jgi:exopolysaccharide biosynthesis polyprenyl glycosylphosphotransferase